LVKMCVHPKTSEPTDSSQKVIRILGSIIQPADVEIKINGRHVIELIGQHDGKCIKVCVDPNVEVNYISTWMLSMLGGDDYRKDSV
jgi:hypothetical protein